MKETRKKREERHVKIAQRLIDKFRRIQGQEDIKEGRNRRGEGRKRIREINGRKKEKKKRKGL